MSARQRQAMGGGDMRRGMGNREADVQDDTQRGLVTRRGFLGLAGMIGCGAGMLALGGCAGDGAGSADSAESAASSVAGGPGANPTGAGNNDTSADDAPDAAQNARPSWSDPDVGAGLVRTGSLALKWATGFTVDLYEGGHALACIADGTRYLFCAPQVTDSELASVPDDIVVLERPLDNIYLASSSTLCLFDALDAIDTVSFVSVTEQNCTVDAFTQAIAQGAVAYGGKYSAPDYEAFMGGGCRLAIENTMIYHTPEVREKLIELGVPVIVEQSSMESEPMGRLEWIALWGAMLDKTDLAQSVLDEQAGLVKQVAARIAEHPLDRTVAFFYINANGAAVVRKPGDYVAKMIAMAGGTYVPSQMDEADENRSSSTTMEMEAFYAGAKDADVVIYNSTVAGELNTLDELCALNPLLADFTAVKNHEVWCCEQNVYQQMTSTGAVVADLHEAIAGAQRDTLDYLFRLA